MLCEETSTILEKSSSIMVSSVGLGPCVNDFSACTKPIEDALMTTTSLDLLTNA